MFDSFCCSVLTNMRPQNDPPKQVRFRKKSFGDESQWITWTLDESGMGNAAMNHPKLRVGLSATVIFHPGCRGFDSSRLTQTRRLNSCCIISYDLLYIGNGSCAGLTLIQDLLAKSMIFYGVQFSGTCL